VSQESIKLIVADGTYTSGITHASPYIAAFDVQGNDANPQNCVLDCRSTNPASYVKGAGLGQCITTGASGNLTIHGFTCQSWESNIGCGGGVMRVSNCNLTSPGHGVGVINSSGGGVNFSGNMKYTSTGPVAQIFVTHGGGLGLGYYNQSFPNLNLVLNWTFTNEVSCTYVMASTMGGGIALYNQPGIINISGPPSGHINAPEFYCDSGGGLSRLVGGLVFPADPGVSYPPGWAIA
jgi:hypothetical protein